MPDSERAGFGGQNFGRGYPRDQADGDKGWGVAYELNYSVRSRWLAQVQPYAVVDTAQAWHNRGPVEDAHLASLALGVRLGVGMCSMWRWKWPSRWRMWRWIAWTVGLGCR